MLHVWLPNQQSDLFVWEEKQSAWCVYNNWQQIANEQTDKSICLYFPSAHLLQLEKEISVKQLKQLGETGQQYLFEELSLTPVEKLSVKHIHQADRHNLVACSKIDINQWQSSASIVGLKVQALLPDFLLLPHTDTQTEDQLYKRYLYQDTNTTLFRSGKTFGNAVSYLPLFLDSLEPASELVLVPAILDASSCEESADLLQNNAQGIIVENSAESLKPVNNANRHPLNFTIANKSSSGQSPYLKVTLFIAILALTVQIMVDGMTSKQLQKANLSVRKNISKQFQAWFPEQRLNGRVALQRQLEPYLLKNNSGTDPIAAFDTVSMLLKQSGMVAKSLLIEDSKIDVQLLAKHRNELDAILENMSQQGMNAQLGSITNVNDDNEKSMGFTLVANIIILSSPANDG